MHYSQNIANVIGEIHTVNFLQTFRQPACEFLLHNNNL